MFSLKTGNFKAMLLTATILPGPLVLFTPVPASAQIGIAISVQLAPPMLPVYVQPPIPEVGYIWTPGYWLWDASTGYYWVPGTWIQPPQVDVLWTPPYWGWSDGLYLFHGGYWGSHVGYYGGVNYGYGYGGSGFEGGRWEAGHFAYNQSVNNFGSVHITNQYRQPVTVTNATHVSYAGGAGGIKSEPTEAERQAEHENHIAETSAQTSHATAAARNPALAASHNNGRPEIAATSRPGQFSGAGVVHPAAEAHQTGRPAQPAAARAAEPAAARSEQHAAVRPAQQAALPQQHAAARPQQHAAPHPQQHAAAPRPAQHEAPRAVVARAAPQRSEPAHAERPHEK